MNRGILIAGTGTDVGKTVLTTGLLRLCMARGLDAMVMKPVQTGALSDAEGRCSAPDVDCVVGASGLTIDENEREDVCPYLFAPACSPHLAARMAGRTISIERIVRSAQRLSALHRVLLVESAGGIMVPLNDTQTTLDLAAALELPVILLGLSGLGTINHVLLTLEAMRTKRLDVMGVVLNDLRPISESDRFIHEDNVCAIQRFGRVKVLARIPHLGTPIDFDLLDRCLAPLGELLA